MYNLQANFTAQKKSCQTETWPNLISCYFYFFVDKKFLLQKMFYCQGKSLLSESNRGSNIAVLSRVLNLIRPKIDIIAPSLINTSSIKLNFTLSILGAQFPAWDICDQHGFSTGQSSKLLGALQVKREQVSFYWGVLFTGYIQPSIRHSA